jgi:hypothetical protein
MRLLLTFLLIASSTLAQSSTGGSHAVTSSITVADSSGIPSRAWAPGPIIPYLPVSEPPSTLPNTSGYTTISGNTTAAILQTSINTAAAGCDNGGGSGATGYLITIAQGTVLTTSGTSGIHLPVTTCTVSRIVIQASPSITYTPGVRIDPSDPTTGVGAMPKITSSTTNGVTVSCATEVPCAFYTLLGIEIEATGGGGFPIPVQIPIGGTISPSNLPHDIIFDHSYIHARLTTSLNHCTFLSGNNIVIIDSWISDCHGNEAQAINAYEGGPWLWQNDFLEGSGENILLNGGSSGQAQTVSGLNTHDLTERHNWYYKPLAWLDGYPTSVVYQGIFWAIKNSHEYKGCVRCLVENSVIENNWLSAQTGQNLLVNNATSQNGQFTHTQDVTFRYIYSIGGYSPLESSGADVSLSTRPYPLPSITEHEWFENILFENTANTFCSAIGGQAACSGSLVYSYPFSRLPVGVVLNHLTQTVPSTMTNGPTFVSGNQTDAGQVYLSNSIFTFGQFGFFTNGSTGSNTCAANLQSICEGWGAMQLPVMNHNIITDHGSLVCATWFTNTQCPATMSNVGFVNWAAGGGDYRLCTANGTPTGCTSGSTYAANGASPCNANPDGTGAIDDCGADVSGIMSKTSGIRTAPSVWPTGITLSPTSLTCNGTNTVTATAVGGNFTSNGLDLAVHGTAVTPGTVTSSTVVFTPPSFSGTTTITNDLINSSHIMQFTAANNYNAGDVVTVTGTTNSGGIFNVTGMSILAVTGSVFDVPTTHAAVTTAPDSGTATAQIPVVVSNFGFPLAALLTCN